MTQLILALDVPSAPEALALAGSVREQVRWVKVGLELFVAAGPSIVTSLRHDGFAVMLDLKLHDIPETVRRAMSSAVKLGAKMVTVHAGGGSRMLEEARRVADDHDVVTLAVTVLTSLDTVDMGRLGVPESRADHVDRLAGIAAKAGIGGLVCSAHEIARLRAAYPAGVLVVPGIRPAGTEAHDQKLVDTPKAAKTDGASFVVVGRPIRDAAPADRPEVVRRILDELA